MMTEPTSKSLSPIRPSFFQFITKGGWLTLGRFLTFILVLGFFAFMVDGGKFYSVRNLENIVRQSAVYATASLGMTIVIIAGGIDLSIGSIIALSVVITAWVLNLSDPYEGADNRYWIESHPVLVPWCATLLALLVSSLAGMLNGLLIVWLRLVPFIITLGTMLIFRGIAKGLAQEKDIYPPIDSWLTLLMDPTLSSKDPARRWMLFPTGIWVLIFAAVVAAALLRYTRFGRHVFAIGSNEETARLCGVDVGKSKIWVYTLSGFFAGLAGILVFSDIRIGQPTAGISYELYVIAAVVIGGGSLRGGEGSIVGAITGALIISTLYMGVKQMGWRTFIQEIVIGGILIAAVAIDQIRHRYAIHRP